MAQDENPNLNPYFYEAQTADELLFGIYDHVDWLTPDVMNDMIQERQTSQATQQQEQRTVADVSTEQRIENEQDYINRRAEERYAESSAGQLTGNNGKEVQSIYSDLERQEDMWGVEQSQNRGEQEERQGETQGETGRSTFIERQYPERLNMGSQVPQSPSFTGSFTRNPRRRPAVPTYSIGSAPLENNHRVTNAGQYDSNFTQALPWIASLLPDFDLHVPETADLGSGASHNTGNRMPRPGSSSRLTTESARLSNYRRNQDHSPQARLRGPMEFYSTLAGLRQSGISYEEICMAIDLPRLPGLDNEMEGGFQQQDMDCGFQQQEPKLIPWTVEGNNSATLASIAQEVEYIRGQFMISPESLFNHLYRLSQRSFLQREEGVHLTIWTHFMNRWHTGHTRRFEKETKEVIMWLETKFDPANLPTLAQNLVNSIDGDSAIRKLLYMAKVICNNSQDDMTVLGSFYSLLSTHRDVMESNKNLLKAKKKLDVSIKNVKSQITRTGKRPPRFTNTKNIRRDPTSVVTRESVVIDTFARTRWLIVGSADAHYAFASSVLLAAMKAQEYVQREQRKKMEQLKAELKNLREHARLLTERNQFVPGGLVTRRVQLVNLCDNEMLRPIHDVENLMLKRFSEAMKRLENIKVMDLLRSIGGRIPTGLVRALNEIEQIENLRGVGCMEGIVVSDIVKIREVVELEIAKNKHQQQVLEKKNEYLRNCDRIINSTTIVSRPGDNRVGNAGSSKYHSRRYSMSGTGDGAGPSNRYVRENVVPERGNFVGSSNHYSNVPSGNETSGGAHDATSNMGYLERNVLPEGVDGAGYTGFDMYHLEGNETAAGADSFGNAFPSTYYPHVEGSGIPPGGNSTGLSNQYAQRNRAPGVDSTGFINQYRQGSGASRRGDSAARRYDYSQRNERSRYPW